MTPKKIAALVNPDQPKAELTQTIGELACSGELRAGLYLMNGDWHLAHVTSQALDTPLAAHWHALVHRHEPDFPNSNYWFRRVGESPIFPALVQLASQAEGLDQSAKSEASSLVQEGKWDPIRFTDLFSASSPGDWERSFDRQEMALLLAHTLSLESGV